jgi:hypothetical protein
MDWNRPICGLKQQKVILMTQNREEIMAGKKKVVNEVTKERSSLFSSVEQVIFLSQILLSFILVVCLAGINSSIDSLKESIDEKDMPGYGYTMQEMEKKLTEISKNQMDALNFQKRQEINATIPDRKWKAPDKPDEYFFARFGRPRNWTVKVEDQKAVVNDKYGKIVWIFPIEKLPLDYSDFKNLDYGKSISTWEWVEKFGEKDDKLLAYLIDKKVAQLNSQILDVEWVKPTWQTERDIKIAVMEAAAQTKKCYSFKVEEGKKSMIAVLSADKTNGLYLFLPKEKFRHGDVEVYGYYGWNTDVEDVEYLFDRQAVIGRSTIVWADSMNKVLYDIYDKVVLLPQRIEEDKKKAKEVEKINKLVPKLNHDRFPAINKKLFKKYGDPNKWVIVAKDSLILCFNDSNGFKRVAAMSQRLITVDNLYYLGNHPDTTAITGEKMHDWLRNVKEIYKKEQTKPKKNKFHFWEK